MSPNNNSTQSGTRLEDFDRNSGGVIERLVFNHRVALMLFCLIVTVFFGYHLKDLKVSASYEKTLPQSHEYIQNYLENREELRGFGDSLRIVVEAREGNIFNASYLETLANINDEIFILSGVDRPWMKSIFTPVVRW